MINRKREGGKAKLVSLLMSFLGLTFGHLFCLFLSLFDNVSLFLWKTKDNSQHSGPSAAGVDNKHRAQQQQQQQHTSSRPSQSVSQSVFSSSSNWYFFCLHHHHHHYQCATITVKPASKDSRRRRRRHFCVFLTHTLFPKQISGREGTEKRANSRTLVAFTNAITAAAAASKNVYIKTLAFFAVVVTDRRWLTHWLTSWKIRSSSAWHYYNYWLHRTTTCQKGRSTDDDDDCSKLPLF